MSASDTTLYKILLSHLHSGSFDDQTQQDLIEVVKLEYIKIAPVGQLPNPMTEDFISALEIEIRDMLKTVTYGHFDIKSYNLSKKSH